jgi:hypothetical protein
MLRLLSAAAAGLAAFLLCVAPVAAQSCLTSTVLQERLVQMVPGISLRELKAEAAMSFIAAFNAVPPQSNIAVDAVLLVRHEQAPQVVTIFFQRECMVGRAILPVQMLDAILRDIEKEA